VTLPSNDPNRSDDQLDDPPTDEEIDALITRSEFLLDELRTTFATIRTLLRDDE
jgi:hypothetical protein